LFAWRDGSGDVVAVSYGFLSTYPPTQCGLATFTQALTRGIPIEDSGDRIGVVRVIDTPVTSHAPEIVGHLQTQAYVSHRVAAEALRPFDVVIVQHRFDVFGGPDGDQVLAVLDAIHAPVVTIAHAVPGYPTVRQSTVLKQVISASARVVAMSQAARARLITEYGADPSKVALIPHGAVSRPMSGRAGPGQRPLVLTWGVLGPGKGIEWAIDGFQQLRRMNPRPAYIVAGRTDARVLREQGEVYRLRLRERARSVGVSHLVRFAGTYLDELALDQLLGRTDVVLLPYDSREQVVSGVLVEALAAGRPVIATAFPHAVELLSGGAGLIVPQFDAAAIGAALQRVFTEPGLAGRMAAEAERIAPSLAWSAVSAEYRDLVASVLAVDAGSGRQSG
jgi:glycosyltransferase involved in cell wall biosynthesis